LWEARQQNKDMRWAKAEFEQQSSQFKSESNRQWRSPWRWLWDIPLHVGRLATFIGTNWDDFKTRMVGMIIIIVAVLALFGVLNLDKALEFLKQLLNLAK
jgi:hypothetical protein